MKIAMLSSESNPLIKTGGLADVVYSLSKALSLKGHEVIVALPFYKNIRLNGRKVKEIGSYNVTMSWRHQEARIYLLEESGIRFYLIGNPYYFERDGVYGYPDDNERFAFFALASEALLRFLSFDADIVSCHDWQTAMVPTLVKEAHRFDAIYHNTKFTLTIHNPAFKGFMDRYYLGDYFNLGDDLFDSGKVRFDGMVSTLKSGIVYADKIITVSPTHRKELLNDVGGHNLGSVLRLRVKDFVGILNGIDTDEWDSAKDTKIAAPFDSKTRSSLLALNRKDLLSSFHVQDQKGPVYGLVSRLSWQKGIDLVLNGFNYLLRKNCNLVVLGSGEYDLERRFEDLRSRFPDKCGIYIGYNDALAHKIYAGSDFFLMPSLFEPCGISQMISQRYGSLPIVRYTGGLADTVNGYIGNNAETADGIGFNDYNDSGLGYALGMSESLYKDKDAFQRVQRNAMGLDHSWGRSASLYEDLFYSIAKQE